MKAKAFVVALGLLLLVGALGYAVPARAAQHLSGQFGGDLNIALQDFGSTDPTLAAPGDRQALELIYDSLGRIGASLQIEPWAATGWAWDGGTSIVVTLRDDLTFSDGTAYDADDVAVSLSQYTQNAVPRWEITVVDSTTLEFDFTTVDANEAGPGLFFSEGLTAFIAWDAAGVNKYSGPFAVGSQVDGRLTLAANADHFAGRPNLDSVSYWWPFTVERNPDESTKANDAACALMFQDVHLIGWPLLANDLTNTRDCVASHGGFPDGINKTLVNPDPTKSLPHISAIGNPGNDLLYMGFAFNTGSMFVGDIDTPGQLLRSALYQFVNKGNYFNIEPSTAVTHGVINRLNTPWAPVNCAPFIPCDFVVDAGVTLNPDPVFGSFAGSNPNPGVAALDAAGFLDIDGDGVREFSAGIPISFVILAPSFALDARKTTIADDFSTFLGNWAGIRSTVDPYDTWEALDAAIAACTDACMYVNRFTPANPMLPDWLRTMPEILAGTNPASGFNDAAFHLPLWAENSWDQATAALHVGHISHLIGEKAVIAPILTFDVLEAFDFTTFDGWVNMLGGIHNFWSLRGLGLPALGSLAATASVLPITTVASGGQASVQVEVRDLLDNAIEDATVALTATAGTVGAVSGGANGVYTATYTAPTLFETTDVAISATVTRAQYGGTTATAWLTVHAPAVSTLDVAVGRSAPTIDSGGSAQITVDVSDAATGAAVSGAAIVLRTNLPGATITPSSGTTDASGQFSAAFTADVRQGMTFRIIADVDAGAGFETASGSTSLAVNSELGEPPVLEVTKNVPGFEAAYAIGAIAAAFVLVALARRRRED